MIKQELQDGCKCKRLTIEQLETDLFYLMGRFSVYPCQRVENAVIHCLYILSERADIFMNEEKQRLYRGLIKNWRSKKPENTRNKLVNLMQHPDNKFTWH